MPFDKKQKPAPDICPQHFCFFWRQAGDEIALGIYDSLEEGSQHLQPITESGCGCSFGMCMRLYPDGDHDWYEPCEPVLKRAGLPWFYFIPSPYKLSYRSRKAYIAESECLWSKKHWESNT